jgi:outer membrane protein assembly factor BamB
MSIQTNETTLRKPLRLWPGVAAAVTLVLIRFVLPVVAPKAELFGVDAPLLAIIGGLALAAVILLWWLFFSRAPWSERLLAIGVIVVAVIAIYPLTHISIQNGMMGRMFFVYAVPPTLGLALVIAAAVSQRLSPGARRAAMVVAIVLGCGVWTLARTNGIHGGVADMEWRWTPTAEELLLAREKSVEPAPAAIAPPAAADDPKGNVNAVPGKQLPAEAGANVAVTPPSPADTTMKPTAPPVIDTTAGGTKPVDGLATSAPGARPVEGVAASERGAAEVAMSARGVRRVEWPGFRGPERDSVIRGVSIRTDWSTAPPVEIWRRPIGPGWSSFAVAGDRIFTQEQRGDDEMVSAYNLATGEPVWRHRDPVRFWESNGGAGPRGTPTVHNNRVYSLGATGILNALDARTGALLWTRNAATDTGKTVPDWGIASSPLVIDDVVIVAIAGQLAAYDAATGKQRWMGQPGGGGYSSPHFAMIGGVPQVLLLRGARTISVAPADGTLLWEHSSGVPAVSIVQPTVIADGVLIAAGDAMGGLGIRRVAVTRGPAGWTVEERWHSRGLKPYFSDLVVHKGHAYGFDGSILSAIALETGERKWKGGRYGSGQLVLLPDQDLLLITSEDGELALVSATPDKFTEVARFPVLNAKTWNHPVVVGDVLLVRNGEEMAALRLSRAGPAKKDTLEEK